MTLSIEQQVCSLELAKKLKELGVTQESLFIWIGEQPSKKGLEEHYDVYLAKNWNTDALYDWISAFTVAELGEMMKGHELPYYYESEWHSAGFHDMKDGRKRLVAETEADARAKLLIYFIENKLITV